MQSPIWQDLRRRLRYFCPEHASEQQRLTLILAFLHGVHRVSLILQLVEKTGISQLTLDNAIYFDHGMRMALLMFNAEAERRLSEPSTAECEGIRLHNWIERERSYGEKTPIKTELTEATAQMGKVSENREGERAIPRVRFATDICLTEMSFGVKYIAARLTYETYAEIQARDTTKSTKKDKLSKSVFPLMLAFG